MWSRYELDLTGKNNSLLISAKDEYFTVIEFVLIDDEIKPTIVSYYNNT